MAQHTGSNDFYVSVQGQVYDVSNFVQGDHSDITGQPSNGADTLDAVAGIDMKLPLPGLANNQGESDSKRNLSLSASNHDNEGTGKIIILLSKVANRI